MKKLFTTMLLLGAFNASASLILTGLGEDTHCSGTGFDECLLTSLTSSPIFIVMDDKMLMNDEEKAYNVLLGVENNDLSFAQSLADDSGLSVDEVIEAAVNTYNK